MDNSYLYAHAHPAQRTYTFSKKVSVCYCTCVRHQLKKCLRILGGGDLVTHLKIRQEWRQICQNCCHVSHCWRYIDGKPCREKVKEEWEQVRCTRKHTLTHTLTHALTYVSNSEWHAANGGVRSRAQDPLPKSKSAFPPKKNWVSEASKNFENFGDVSALATYLRTRCCEGGIININR